eukprot:m.13490 g.13490  ORF g.13490 m.13490 type:complete len:349 (-) comp5949_c0_seq1:1169-2215(-)
MPSTKVVQGAARGLCNSVLSVLKRHQDASQAAGMKKYLRNQFEFLGIKAPLRKTLCKETLQQWKHEKIRYDTTATLSTQGLGNAGSTELTPSRVPIEECLPEQSIELSTVSERRGKRTRSSTRNSLRSSRSTAACISTAIQKGPMPPLGKRSKAKESQDDVLSVSNSEVLSSWCFYEELVTCAMKLGFREPVYFALDMLSSSAGKRCIPNLEQGEVEVALESLGVIIDTDSWWDTVDCLASHPLGAFWEHHKATTKRAMTEWLKTGSMWRQRSAVLCQLRMRDQTDWKFLQHACLQTMGTSEFFLNKAIGWSLRQYARTNPKAVRSFVAKHDSKLSTLSKREALKHLL